MFQRWRTRKINWIVTAVLVAVALFLPVWALTGHDWTHAYFVWPWIAALLIAALAEWQTRPRRKPAAKPPPVENQDPWFGPTDVDKTHN